MSLISPSEWDQFLAGYPEAHLLQTSAWGELKSNFGWRVERVRVGQNGAQILFRKLPLGFSIGYIAKGPIGPDWSGLWPEIDRLCAVRRAILLKVEPDGWEEDEADFKGRLHGFRPGGLPVQPRRTIVVSLEGPETAWLERMKQKTRYNIRLAERKEICVKPSADVDVFHSMMQITGQRDGFGVHSLDYLRRVYDLFRAAGQVELFLADYQGKPIAGLMVFARGSRAWYLYGASTDEERSRMPAYLVQWEAMRWAMRQGCGSYDLWGVPDEEEAALEDAFENRQDGLWGVYRFKRGFGGQLKRAAQTWEKVYISPLYAIYHWWAGRRGEQ
jgi:lipid II:glycine glycyltransferase (peptidoglycan interpeptide bridge formation enzyme)